MKNWYFVILTLFILIGCNKDEKEVPEFDNSINISLKGTVSLECSGKRMEGHEVKIKWENRTLHRVISDQLGYFEFDFIYEYNSSEDISPNQFNVYVDDHWPEYYVMDNESGLTKHVLNSFENDSIAFILERWNVLTYFVNLHKTSDADYVEFEKCKFYNQFGQCIEHFRDSVHMERIGVGGPGNYTVNYFTLVDGIYKYYSDEVRMPCEGDSIVYVSR